MKIAVASRNPVKIDAAKHAFETLFPDVVVEIMSVDVGSGVSDQPNSDEETRRGARTRAMNANQAEPGAEFWVGMEGGIEIVDGQLMAFAWMAVQGAADELGEARSVSLPLPPAVKELVESGLELGDANDKVFTTTNSKQGGGAYGLLTNGLYTRESVYYQTLIIALTPFVNPMYPQFQQQGRRIERM